MMKLLLTCTFVHMPCTVLEVPVKAKHDMWCMYASALLASLFTYPVALTVNMVFCFAYLKLRDHRFASGTANDSHRIASFQPSFAS